MSKLIIVESPTKVKTIKGYLGKGYEVTASMGHVRDLPSAKLSVDTKKNFEPNYEIIKGKENLVNDLREAVKRNDEVYLATDDDREGEAISWHLATLLGLDTAKENRITFNEITKTGVANGMANPHKINMDLVNAQQARRILDRLVGYRLSPFVSQKIRRGLSAGRVQSVAVRFIVDREEEINAFVPEEYWTIDAKFLASSSRKPFSGTFIGDETGKVKLTNDAQQKEYRDRLDGAKYEVVSVKEGKRRKQPFPPYITSTLQQDASVRLGFQARRTMKVAQELYEGVKIDEIGMTGLITYMRTDSIRISAEARAQGIQYIRENFGGQYVPEKPHAFKSRSNAQDGHEAIRPAIITLTPEQAKKNLTPDQYKLYKLIWNRFMASLMESCIQNTVKAEIKGQSDSEKEKGRYCTFSASGYKVEFDGFTVLYAVEDDEDSENLPELKESDALKLKSIEGNQHFTQPPARYTEGSLIKALEETGIGRPSTYAAIITTIIGREYILRDGKALKPTELGIATTGLLKERFPNIVNTDFTAEMENKLDAVGDGATDYVKMLHEFYDDFEKTLETAKKEMQGVKITLQEDESDIVCDKCGRNMVVKVGRFGKFLACPGYPDCKNTMPLIHETGALCPKCSGKVVEKKSRKGYTFYGCEAYPNCDFVTWDKPTAEKCPTCGKSLFMRRGGILGCLNEGCGYERKAERKKKKGSDE